VRPAGAVRPVGAVRPAGSVKLADTIDPVVADTGAANEADLLIVGAGAKAAAIAAKVHVLNTLGLGPIALTIVEATEHAASWSGRNGMTSGEEPLAIPPIKDIGFPYQSHEAFGQEAGGAIDRAIMAFTWQQHLVSAGGYARWVNAGSPAVQHRDYGRYLTWVLAHATAGVSHVSGRVTRVSLDARAERWAIDVSQPGGTRRYGCRALVLTGPGVHRALPHDPAIAERVFHCDSKREELARIPADRGSEIAIVGGGESALSCVAFLRSFRPAARLTVYTPTLPLSRGESFLENRVFSNPDEVQWSSLDERIRRDFVKHCDRGVFDPRTLEQLAGDEQCRFVTGRIVQVAAAPDGEGLCARRTAPEGISEDRHDYLVNCTGFDLVEQLRGLFPPDVRAEIERRAGPIWSGSPTGGVAIGRFLELEGVRPRLHIPGLGALSQGPGFANLGCLGLLANRVLQPALPWASGARLEDHGRASSSWAASASSAASPAGRPTSWTPSGSPSSPWNNGSETPG
jgi:mycobactin lysine-N-oxygenase